MTWQYVYLDVLQDMTVPVSVLFRAAASCKTTCMGLASPYQVSGLLAFLELWRENREFRELRGHLAIFISEMCSFLYKRYWDENIIQRGW